MRRPHYNFKLLTLFVPLQILMLFVYKSWSVLKTPAKTSRQKWKPLLMAVAAVAIADIYRRLNLSRVDHYSCLSASLFLLFRPSPIRSLRTEWRRGGRSCGA